MRQGDVVWVEFPAGEGRVQAGRRPAVVLQDGALNLPTVAVIPLSSQFAALRFPATVLIDANATNGLRVPSVALVFQVRAVDPDFVGKRLGTISEAELNELLAALDVLTGR